MPLDPIAARLLQQMAEAGGPAITELSPVEARAMFESFKTLAGVPEPVDSQMDLMIPGPAGEIPATITTPKNAPNSIATCSSWRR